MSFPLKSRIKQCKGNQPDEDKQAPENGHSKKTTVFNLLRQHCLSEIGYAQLYTPSDVESISKEVSND